MSTVRLIQGVSAKTFEPNISIICQRIFMHFKMQIFWTVKVQLVIIKLPQFKKCNFNTCFLYRKLCASAKRDDRNSAKLRVCFIRVYVFAFAATFNTFFCFFLANQTSFKDEFFPTAFFIDDQFFMLIDSTF
jgi:hypothetical protein